MNLNRREKNGITLIALIITIIVMLILVGVTITVAMQGGLFDTARKAGKDTQMEADKETLSVAVAGAMNVNTGKIETAQSLLDNLPEGWNVEEIGIYTCTSPKGNTFTVDEEGNITYIGEGSNDDIADLKLLRKYFIGDNIGERDFINLIENPEASNMIFKNDETSITDANTSLHYLGLSLEGLYDIEDSMITNFYVKYHDKAYKVVCYVNIASETPNYMTQNVNLIYKPSGEEGNTVEYSYDGTEANKKQWTILYDNGSNKEIVSPEVLGSITLGKDDPQACGADNIEKAIDSYNNALTRINNYTAGLVTNTNKLRVRNAGSNPTNPTEETNQYYSSDELKQWNEAYNGRGKLGDTNYEQDFVRICYWGAQETDKSYWMSSRISNITVTHHSDGSLPTRDITFAVQYMSGAPNVEIETLWSVYDTGEVYTNSNTYGVRPIVKVSSDSL